MIKEEFSGKTVEEAINNGLAKMGIEKSQAKITVVEEGGFLKKAKVVIEQVTEGEKALAFLEELYSQMGSKCTCELNETDDCATINVISVDSSSIIGYRGEVLDAAQYLASIIANEGKEEFKRIVVDCEGYRDRRNDTLKELAKKMADKAVKNGRPIKLEPMNAFERRIIHSALMNDERVTTASFGEEPSRYLTITPKDLKPRNKKGNYNGKKGGHNKGGYNNKNGGKPTARRSGKSSPVEGGFSVYGFYGKSESSDNEE